MAIRHHVKVMLFLPEGFNFKYVILSSKLSQLVSLFVRPSGLLLQESNKFSEALHFYKLAIGSRPTLACKYSSSFFFNWQCPAPVVAVVPCPGNREQKLWLCEGKEMDHKGHWVKSWIKHSGTAVWAAFKAQLCQQNEYICDVMYWEFRPRCFYLFCSFVVSLYFFVFFKLLSVFS